MGSQTHKDPHKQGHEHHEGHAPTRKSLDWTDFVFGAVAFYCVTLGVYHLVSALVPGLMSESALTQVQISGAIFFLFWVFVGNLVFKPFFELLERREDKTSGAEDLAQQNSKKSFELEITIAKQLQTARLQGIQKRDELVNKAKVDAAELLAIVHKENSAKAAAAKHEIEVAKRGALSDVESEADRLAALIVDRALSATSSAATVH